MRARTIGLVAVLLAPLVAPAPASGFLPPEFGGEVAAPLSEQPLSLDPVRATRGAEIQLVSLLYDTLYRLGRGTEVQPHLAAALPQPLSGGKCCVIPLRSGVVLHDGRTLSASDVVAALKRLRSTRHSYLLPRAGAIVATSQETVEIALEGGSPRSLALSLSLPASAVAIRRGGELIGGGPFRLHRRDKTRLILDAHGSHFAGRPYLDRLTFRVFARASTEVATYQVGASQLSTHGVSVFGGVPRHRPESLVGRPWTTVALQIGRGRSWSSSASLRQALSLAIDRGRLAKLVGFQSRAATTLLPGGPAAAPTVAHDRRRSRQLLSAIKRQHTGVFGGRLALLVDASRPDDRVLAGQLVADFDQVGLAVSVQSVAPAQFSERVGRGQADLALVQLVAPLPLPQVALAQVFSRAGQQQRARDCLASEVDAMTGFAQSAQQLALVPLVRLGVRVHYDARLGGVRLTPGGTITFADVYWRRAR